MGQHDFRAILVPRTPKHPVEIVGASEVTDLELRIAVRELLVREAAQKVGLLEWAAKRAPDLPEDLSAQVWRLVEFVWLDSLPSALKEAVRGSTR